MCWWVSRLKTLAHSMISALCLEDFEQVKHVLFVLGLKMHTIVLRLMT